MRKEMLFLVCLCLGVCWSVNAEEKSTVGGKPAKKNADSSFADSFSFTSSHEPIHVRSRTLEFFYEEKRIVYHDEVIATQGDSTLKSDLLTVFYEDAPSTPDAAPAKSNTAGAQETGEKAAAASAPEYSQNVKNVIADAKPTTETSDAPPSAESLGAAADKVKNQGKKEKSEGGEPSTSKQRIKEIIAEGHVEITSGNRHATSNKAVYDETQRTLVLTGNARVQELSNWVSGERVTMYLDEKRSVVESGGGDRRAEMEIIQQQGTTNTGAEKKGVKKP